jgi:uncharacterized protein YecE (DUF72 family)
MTRAGVVRIGISGWTYPPWRGAFYPKGLPQKRELEYATSQFSSLEINGTFYGMQRPDAFGDWADRAPDGFVYAVKGPRYITHMRRLRQPERPLANFIASGLLRLGKAGADPVAVPTELPLRRREDRDFPEAAAARHRCGGAPRSQA